MTTSRPLRALALGAIAFLALSCDQVAKSVAVESLSDGGLSFWGGVVRFELAHNVGGFLGLGKDLPPGVRHAAFVLLTACALAGLAWWGVFGSAAGHRRLIGAALLFGGGLGNFVDRLFNEGAVVDFMVLQLGNLQTGVFNLADVTILLGAAALALSAGGEAGASSRQAED